MADRPKPVDPLSEASQRAHERALRDMEQDTVLADKLHDLKAAGGADPFHYDLFRKRTGRNAVPADAPPDKPRGGTQPSLPTPPENDTLVDIAPPDVLTPPSAIDSSRTDDTVFVPRQAAATPGRPALLVGVIALSVIGVGVAVLLLAGGDAVVAQPSSRPATTPAIPSAAPIVKAEPTAPPSPSPPSPSPPLPPPSPTPSTQTSAPREPVRTAPPIVGQGGAKPQAPPTSAAPTAPPAAPPPGSHKSAVPEKPIF